MDRRKVRAIEAAMLEAVAGVAERFEVQITYGGGRFDSTSAQLRFRIAERDASGTALTPDRTDFATCATMLGLELGDLDRVFVFRGESYVLRGIRLTSRKFPVVGERVRDQKRFKFMVSDVQLALGRNVTLSPLGR